MRFKDLHIVLILAFFSANLWAQKTDVLQVFEDAEYYLYERRYDKALPFYLQLLESRPENYMLNYRVGQCYFNILYDQEKALPYLLKASERVSKRFVENKFDQNVASNNTFLMLGELYQKQEELVEALKYYKEYKKNLRSTDEDELKIINKKIESIYVAHELQKTYIPYSAISLGGEINTRHSDYNPVISKNEDVLIYTSYWETIDLLFYSEKDKSGNWSRPYNITRIVGSMGDCYSSALSPDGNDLYLIQIDPFNSDIFVSHRTEDGWTFMERLSNKVNSSSMETSVGLSSDGNTMFLSSNRPGGEGGLDLYMCTKDEKGEWGKPVNLGSKINTAFDEEAPFLTDNDNVLFFSSKGHESMGGHDIFYAKKDKYGNWSAPVNVGYPINSTKDDLFYVPVKRGNEGYFVRDLPGGYGLVDIYKIDIPYNLLFSDKLIAYKQKRKADTAYIKETEQAIKKQQIKDTVYQDIRVENNIVVYDQDPYEVPGIKTKAETKQSEEVSLEEIPEYASLPGNKNTEYQSSETNALSDQARITKETTSGSNANTKGSSPPSPAKLPRPGIGVVTTAAATTGIVAASQTSKSAPVSTPSGSNNDNNSYKTRVSDEPAYFSDTETEQVAYKTTSLTESTVLDNSISDHTESPRQLTKPGINTTSTTPVTTNSEVRESEMNSNTVYSESKTSDEITRTDIETNNAEVTKTESRHLAQLNKSTGQIYTIQVIALVYAVDASYFKNIHVKVSRGNDRFTRYTYGEYSSYSKAKAELRRIRSLGYKDAFIREVSTISNYGSGN